MDLSILNRVSQLQNKNLNVLYLAYQECDNQWIFNQFKKYENYHFDVICTSNFSRSAIRMHKAPGKNVSLYLQDDPTFVDKSFDVIITASLRYRKLGTLFNTYKFKYVLTLNDEELIPCGYQRLGNLLFKKIEETPVQIQKTELKQQQLTEEQKQKIAEKNELFKQFVEQYELKPVKYGKYGINYLYDVVPGKISIIMIVSQRNNAFADLIRELKAQNVESVEYIIIDNAAGFRNNIKPNIRYGEKMPLDFCEYHAKQISSGEYIIVLNETSESFKIADYISKGKYETR